MGSASFEDPKLQALLEKIARDENFAQPKYSINVGTKPGDNFVGRIFRTVIKETDKSKSDKCLSLIFKASPLGRQRQEAISCDRLFANETKAYLEVLPTLNNFLKKHGLVDSACFPGTARCYAAEMGDGSKDDDVHVLVLEDKAVEGFRLTGRSKGLDNDHARHVLEKLAFLHASSLALMQHEPEAMKRVTDDLAHKHMWFQNVKHPLLDVMRKSCLPSFEMLREPYKKGNPVYDKLEEKVKNFNSEYVRLNQVPSDLVCITHGDCWTNNLLFQYNKDGSVKDVCILDFQLTKLGSVALDIVYAIFLCTTKEVRDAHYDDLIRYYYSKMTSHLKALGCDPQEIFPWERLQEQLKSHGLFGLLLAMMAVPLFVADDSELSVDISSEEHDESLMYGAKSPKDFKNREEISKRLTDAIIDAVRLGFI